MAAAQPADQLSLDGAAPRLSEQQQLIYDALQQAGAAGLHGDEAGALAHSAMTTRNRHDASERCIYCGSRGMQLLKALRRKGLAKYRRGTPQTPGYWQAVGYEKAREQPRGMTDEIPY